MLLFFVLQVVVNGFFQRWQFTHCARAIDGTHIQILAPKDNPLDYWNREQCHSVVMQALVDININSWISTLDGQGIHMIRVYWLIQIFTSRAKQGPYCPINQTICCKNVHLLFLGIFPILCFSSVILLILFSLG